MKEFIIKLLFRFFSFQADISKGKPMMVKYKQIFGTLLVSVSAYSCTKATECYSPIEGKDSTRIQEPTCYEPALPVDSSGNTFVTCYDTAETIFSDE